MPQNHRQSVLSNSLKALELYRRTAERLSVFQLVRCPEMLNLCRLIFLQMPALWIWTGCSKSNSGFKSHRIAPLRQIGPNDNRVAAILASDPVTPIAGINGNHFP